MMSNAMTNPSDIERIVMRRVHLIRILRVIISGAVFAVLVTLLALWGIGKEVWVAHVFENMPHSDNLGAFVLFWEAAFAHTRLVVQVLSVLTFVSFLYFVRESFRLMKGLLPPVAA
jgi:hypothetical protein